MFEFLFNLVFLLLLIRFYGEWTRDFYFSAVYQRLTRWIDPPIHFVEKLLPENLKKQAIGVFIFLFFLIRALHYYSYRSDVLGMEWGPAVLVLRDATFFSACVKSVIVTALFYFQFLSIVLLFEAVSRIGMIQDPYWRIFSRISSWPKTLFSRFSPWKGRVSFALFVFAAMAFLFTLLFFLILAPFGKKAILVPGGSAVLSILPKMLLLNLFVATSFFYVLFCLLLVRALLSWFFPMGLFGMGELIYKLTDPVISWFARWRLQTAGIDFSVLVATFLCLFTQQLIRRLLIWLYLQL